MNSKHGLEDIFKKYYRGLVYYAKKILLDEMDAEDAVVNVFLRVHKTIADIQTPKYFLYRAVKNECRDRQLEKERHDKAHKSLLYVMGEEDYTEEMIEAWVVEELYNRIEKLPKRKKLVIQYYMAGKTTSWISNKLHISSQTALNTKNIATNDLKSYISNAIKTK